jgi:hypothetical protein
MRKAGGIIALIAGIFGVLAALATLTVGGIGAAFAAKGAGQVVWLGWGGILFSFLTIILGAVCLGTRSALPGILLVLSAILGAVLGGTLVANCMVLALIGGVLALFGSRSTAGDASPSMVAQDKDGPPSLNADEMIARYVQKSTQLTARATGLPRAPATGFGRRGA